MWTRGARSGRPGAAPCRDSSLGGVIVRLLGVLSVVTLGACRVRPWKRIVRRCGGVLASFSFSLCPVAFVLGGLIPCTVAAPARQVCAFSLILCMYGAHFGMHTHPRAHFRSFPLPPVLSFRLQASGGLV